MDSGLGSGPLSCKDVSVIKFELYTGESLSDVLKSPSMLSVCVSGLLDAGLHADHPAGDVGGPHSGLEVDDPDLRQPQHHPHLPLQGETSSSATPASSCICIQRLPAAQTGLLTDVKGSFRLNHLKKS